MHPCRRAEGRIVSGDVYAVRDGKWQLPGDGGSAVVSGMAYAERPAILPGCVRFM
jgi:hypothetical protein